MNVLRDLKASDVFIMSKIIGKIGLNEFKDCLKSEEVVSMIEKIKDEEKENDEEEITKVGIAVFTDVANILFDNLPKAEEDIYRLLSNLSGMTVEEVKNTDMVTFMDMVFELVQKEQFKDFFQHAAKLLK